MVIVRVMLANESASAIARGAVVATRYCTVRRQFTSDGDNTKEANVIGYTMVQYRLFPILAYAYAMLFTGRWMNEMYDKLDKGLAKGDVSLLPEVHAVSSALKSYGTGLAADSIEECRKVCGGHGFSQV
jgi:acyl-CoA oxidase